MATKTKAKGKTWRKDLAKKGKKLEVEKSRNWTDLETEEFCRILADPDTNFCVTLETKALKKTANKEVFESIQLEFTKRLSDEKFADENRLFNDDIDDGTQLPELDLTISKLRNKYNNLKKEWRKRVDRAKIGSGLRVEAEAVWFQIIHPVLTDAHSTLDDLASQAEDLSFVQEDSLVSESEVDSTGEGDGTSEDEDDGGERDAEVSCSKDDKGESEEMAEREKGEREESEETAEREKEKSEGKSKQKKKGGKLTIRPHEKRTAPRSQTQALGNLATGVSRMADMQAKRLKLQEESENFRRAERESLLEFRREEAEKNRQHELTLAGMYMRILAQPATAPATPPAANQQYPHYALVPPDQHWPNHLVNTPANSPPALYTPPQVRQNQGSRSNEDVDVERLSSGYLPTYRPRNGNQSNESNPWVPSE